MKSCRAIVVIGDTHFGSSVGLAPPVVTLEDGHELHLRGHSRFIWRCWQDFWKWVGVVAGPSYVLVHNGDVLDNRHHSTLQLISGNLSTQKALALQVLSEPVRNASLYFQLRGTPAHSGESAELEEDIAWALKTLKYGSEWAKKAKKSGQSASSNDLWIELGGEILHFAHHISFARASAYKSSPAMRLMSQAFADAGESGLRPPNIMVRSHVHDYIEVKRPNCRVVVCPCWQGKTQFMWKNDTISQPVIGGLIIKLGVDGIHIRERTYRIPRPNLIHL